MKNLFALLFVCFSSLLKAQLAPLTIEKIMADPKWMGTQPSQPQWNITSDTLFFMWNPEAAPADSLYYITLQNKKPQKLTAQQKKNVVFANMLTYNAAKTKAVYVKSGDIFLYDVATKQYTAITNTTEFEFNASFTNNDRSVAYQKANNLFAWHVASGATQQLTNFVQNKDASPASLNEQESWLKKDQLETFEVLKERKKNKDAAEAYTKSQTKKEIRKVVLDDKQLRDLQISPNGKCITFNLFKADGKNKVADVPNYVTETGFTTNIATRPKVGEQLGTYSFHFFDIEKDTVIEMGMSQLPGIKDIPSFHKDYSAQFEKLKKENKDRAVEVQQVEWNNESTKALVEIVSQDNKDRWLMILSANGSLNVADRQTDSAWIGGPMQGIIGKSMGWLDEQTCWFHSEKTGYNHLYSFNTSTKTTKAITEGNFEVQQALLSNDKKSFYITTNKIHPGEKHLYKQFIGQPNAQQLTEQTGANLTTISPNQMHFANLYSYSNKPWELYLQAMGSSKFFKITNSAQSNLFKTYAWREPQIVTFAARDGATVYGRLYKPTAQHNSKPAVIFVHGAGYLQNAHKWWSNYFREYMFHNLLADNGYTVLDIDYRASAGYGRDCRTGIYRFMGGKDLSDHVDAAQYLVKEHNVNKQNIGIYGGSYGGFITLMALFTESNVFAAGAALRPVTNWGNYNHGYTSNILNLPANDSMAYKKSSPLYFANGLKNALLICHGTIDLNVHYQDVVQLQQKLIELGKDNWEVASYPLEDHGFKEPSSWTDEYKRIFKLFETHLKK
jgi:dipeptidyl aminopeptidase/acylaminoacyl peptidase